MLLNGLEKFDACLGKDNSELRELLLFALHIIRPLYRLPWLDLVFPNLFGNHLTVLTTSHAHLIPESRLLFACLHGLLVSHKPGI